MKIKENKGEIETMNDINYNRLNRWEIIELANERIKSLVEDLFIESVTNDNDMVATQEWRNTMRKHHDKMLERLLIKNEGVSK